MKNRTIADRVAFSRRKFLQGTVATSTLFTIVPRHVLSGRRYIAPSDKLNIAAIGSGGKGADNIQKCFNSGSANIVALCDVDDKSAASMVAKFPEASYHRDFREMLDKKHRSIDAVIIATPDHTHAVATLACMQMHKHVYTQKPLTHDIYEARMLTKAAAKYPKLVTQMGNQGSSGDDTRNVEAMIQSGLIGDVHRVHCWTNRPVWPQGIATPEKTVEIPQTLDWNLWLGTAPDRGYNPTFAPFRWRGWWDYGTGALGDMACHFMDVPFRACKLGYPTEVQCSIGSVFADFFKEEYFPDSCPPSSVIYFTFPSRGNLPALELVWYDGGIQPRRPDELGPDEPFGDWDGGLLFEGSKGKLVAGEWGQRARVLSKSSAVWTVMPPSRAFVPGGAQGHEMQWVAACKAVDPLAVSSPFSQAGPLTETLLMGNLAIRSYMYREEKTSQQPGGQAGGSFVFPGRKKLLWDGEAMKITNFEPANKFVRRSYAHGWPDLKV